MKELVEIIAKALVDNPDEVVVTEKEEGRHVTVELRVASSDMGKVMYFEFMKEPRKHCFRGSNFMEDTWSRHYV